MQEHCRDKTVETGALRLKILNAASPEGIASGLVIQRLTCPRNSILSAVAGVAVERA